MTNTQKSYTAELRLQSANPSSRWTWTAGVFWQQAKEGSIEELKSTNIDQVFNYLYGLAPADFYGAALYSCPTNAAYPAIPACDIYYNNNTTIDRQIAVRDGRQADEASHLDVLGGDRPLASAQLLDPVDPEDV